MEFKDLIKIRRSCRSFESSEVSDEQLDYIMNAGVWAPSPLNLQPWEFIVIRDREIKSQIRKIAEDAKQEVLKNDGPKWVTKYDAGFLEEAPVLLVILVDPSKAGLGKFFGQKYGVIQAGAICIQNMMLAAADLGLASLYFTFFRPEKLKPILNIPDEYEVIGIIPIGKAKGPMNAPGRKEPKVYLNYFEI